MLREIEFLGSNQRNGKTVSQCYNTNRYDSLPVMAG